MHYDDVMATWTSVVPEIDGWTAAEELERRLAAGGTLLELDSPIPLAPGEILHAGVEAHCSWYGPADVTYAQQRLLIFGSAPWLALSATASALGNHRRRRSADALATPQWRPLGHTHVLVTNTRLLVRHGDEFLPFLHASIAFVADSPDPQHLEIHFTNGTALSLHGDWAHYVDIALCATTIPGDSVGEEVLSCAPWQEEEALW